MLAHWHRGTFIRRYKRFFADVRTEDGQQLTLHCPNTGAMTGLLQPGSDALFSLATAQALKKRKTPGTLEALRVGVQAQHYWVGVNTHNANTIARQWLEQPEVQQEFNIRSVQAEVKLMHLMQETSQHRLKTRVDFVAERHQQKPLLIEVKSVTLLADAQSDIGRGQGFFPDTISVRALAQLHDLLVMKAHGFDVVVLYVSQHQAITQVLPAAHIDPNYAALVKTAQEQGVVCRTLGFNPAFYGLTEDKTQVHCQAVF